MPIANDLRGQRFGRLVAMDKIQSKKDKKGKSWTYWKCICDCGNSVEVRSKDLHRGHRSCKRCEEIFVASLPRKSYQRVESMPIQMGMEIVASVFLKEYLRPNKCPRYKNLWELLKEIRTYVDLRENEWNKYFRG